jgi:hypothetical protein
MLFFFLLHSEEGEEIFGGLMCKERSGTGFEEGSMKTPSKGIFFTS